MNLWKTNYNLGTDLTLTTPNSFKQKKSLITCVREVDAVGDWYTLKCQWFTMADSPHY